MLVVLFVILLFVVVLSAIVIVVLVKGNASLKAQYRTYVSAANSVYDNNANVIIGMQQQVEDLLARRADDQAILTAKDGHIVGLIAELELAAEKVAILEKLSAEATAELDAAIASEFALKAKLANTEANYTKVEAYALGAMKKSSPSIFEDCNQRLDEKFIFEDELGIHWFK